MATSGKVSGHKRSLGAKHAAVNRELLGIDRFAFGELEPTTQMPKLQPCAFLKDGKKPGLIERNFSQEQEP